MDRIISTKWGLPKQKPKQIKTKGHISSIMSAKTSVGDYISEIEINGYRAILNGYHNLDVNDEIEAIIYNANMVDFKIIEKNYFGFNKYKKK